MGPVGEGGEQTWIKPASQGRIFALAPAIVLKSFHVTLFKLSGDGSALKGGAGSFEAIGGMEKVYSYANTYDL